MLAQHLEAKAEHLLQEGNKLEPALLIPDMEVNAIVLLHQGFDVGFQIIDTFINEQGPFPKV